MSIPMIANPFIFAIGNLLMPKAAHAFGSGGVKAVVRLIVAAAAASAGLLLPFGVVLLFAGESILELMYGPKFAGSGATLAILGFAPLVWSTTSVLGCGQAALKQTKASFVATLSGLTVSAVAIAVLAPTWDVPGAAMGLLCGSVAMCIAQIWQFWRRCRELTLQLN
jgi:O-antigen/teichoic acid export membrane protein